MPRTAVIYALDQLDQGLDQGVPIGGNSPFKAVSIGRCADSTRQASVRMLTADRHESEAVSKSAAIIGFTPNGILMLRSQTSTHELHCIPWPHSIPNQKLDAKEATVPIFSEWTWITNGYTNPEYATWILVHLYPVVAARKGDATGPNGTFVPGQREKKAIDLNKEQLEFIVHVFNDYLSIPPSHSPTANTAVSAKISSTSPSRLTQAIVRAAHDGHEPRGGFRSSFNPALLPVLAEKGSLMFEDVYRRLML